MIYGREEISAYLVQAHARYVRDAGKWQPILCMTRLRSATEIPISQTLNYFPVLFESETDAIRYGSTKSRVLVRAPGSRKK
jgi:hypothetical protein